MRLASYLHCLTQQLPCYRFCAMVCRGQQLWHLQKQVTKDLLACALDKWKSEVITGSTHIAYTSFQPSPSSALTKVRTLGLSWADLKAVRAWCQMRAGIFNFCHISGERSHASVQRCIFCDYLYGNITKARMAKHVLGGCTFWATTRVTVVENLGITDSRPDPITMTILRVTPDTKDFLDIVRFCFCIIRKEQQFWWWR